MKDIPLTENADLRREVRRRLQAGEPVRAQELAPIYNVGITTVKQVMSIERALLQAGVPLNGQHHHDWGPWVWMRQCIECGEQDIRETDMLQRLRQVIEELTALKLS